jgi:hypothetical protein
MDGRTAAACASPCFHAADRRNPPERRAKLRVMSAHGGEHVTLRGDLSGEYVVVEKRDDGSLIVAPDTSVGATLTHHGLEPATLEDFEAEFGPVQPADGEG